jgi:hypothetical protein
MSILQWNQTGIHRHNFQVPPKIGKMLKMIIANHNKKIRNLILHRKIIAGRPIKKYTVVSDGNTRDHCTNP